MLFHAHKKALRFELGGKIYAVPHGHEVEVPDHLAYCIKARGIELAHGASPGAARAVAEDVARPVVNVFLAAQQATPAEAADALADVTGEDPPEDGDEGEEGDESAAQRTADALERQGIRVPGRRPGRKARE